MYADTMSIKSQFTIVKIKNLFINKKGNSPTFLDETG